MTWDSGNVEGTAVMGFSARHLGKQVRVDVFVEVHVPSVLNPVSRVPYYAEVRGIEVKTLTGFS